MWHALTYILTFPEGLIWPGLRHGWYPILCVSWLPIGVAAFVVSLFTSDV